MTPGPQRLMIRSWVYDSGRCGLVSTRGKWVVNGPPVVWVSWESPQKKRDCYRWLGGWMFIKCVCIPELWLDEFLCVYQFFGWKQEFCLG